MCGGYLTRSLSLASRTYFILLGRVTETCTRQESTFDTQPYIQIQIYIHAYIRWQRSYIRSETDHKANAKSQQGNRARQQNTKKHSYTNELSIFIERWIFSYLYFFVVIIISERAVEYASSESIWNDSLNLSNRSNIHRRTGNNEIRHFDRSGLDVLNSMRVHFGCACANTLPRKFEKVPLLSVCQSTTVISAKLRPIQCIWLFWMKIQHWMVSVNEKKKIIKFNLKIWQMSENNNHLKFWWNW